MTSPTDPITLSTIEPLATAGLAVTLAYLALDRFRYRRAIEKEACKLHQKFCEDEDIGTQTGLDDWNEVLWLTRQDANGFRPAGFWGGLYRRVFRKHYDVRIIAALAIISGLVLAVGVARELGTWSFLEWVDTKPAALIFFYLCLSAAVLPLVAVYGGHSCTNWGRRRAHHCNEQLLIFQRTRAGSVEAPE